MSISNTVAVLIISTASKRQLFDKVYPKNGDAVPNWKYFQISAASSPPGFKKKISLFIPRSLGIAECELQELV